MRFLLLFLLLLPAFRATIVGTPSFAQFAAPADEASAGVGIALGIKDDGAFFVAKLMADSPAAASQQIHEGDRIIAVGQGEEPAVPLAGMKMEDCVALVRGSAGSRVRLTVLPESAASDSPAAQARDVLLTRDDLLHPLGLALDATLLKVGSGAPLLRYVNLGDGTVTTMAEACRGRIVVVQFWATWSDVSRRAVAEVQKLAAAHASQKDKVTFLTISIDGDSAGAQAAAVQEKVKAQLKKTPWPQTLNGWAPLEGRSEWYVGAVPLIYLIGADGKILAANPAPSAVSKLLAPALKK